MKFMFIINNVVFLDFIYQKQGISDKNIRKRAGRITGDIK